MSRCIPCVYKEVLTMYDGITNRPVPRSVRHYACSTILIKGTLSLSHLVARVPRRPGLPSNAGAAKSAMSETDVIPSVA